MEKDNKCAKCGEIIDIDKSFCPNCGEKIQKEEKEEIKQEEILDNKEEYNNEKPVKKKNKVLNIFRYIFGVLFLFSGLANTFNGQVLQGQILILLGVSLLPIIYKDCLSYLIKSQKALKIVQIVLPIVMLMILANVIPSPETNYSENNNNNTTFKETDEQKAVRIIKSNINKPNQEIITYEPNEEQTKFDFVIKSSNNSYTPYTCAMDAQSLAKSIIGLGPINSIKLNCIKEDKTIYYVKVNKIDESTSEDIKNNTIFYNANDKEVKTTLATLKSNDVKDYKKQCAKLKYKDVLRNPNNYLGKKAYWFGQIVQVVTKRDNYSVFRIAVNCEKLTYIKEYICDDAIYVTYYGDKSFIDDDMVKMWGIMDGVETYTTVLGSDLTIPRFTAEYMELQ